MCGPGGLRQRRLLVDPEGVVQRRRHAVLDDRPPDRGEVVAHPALEGALVCLYLVPYATHDRILVAFGAGAAVEQRAETGRGRENRLKHGAAKLKPAPVLPAQMRQRTADAARGADERQVGAGRRRGTGCAGERLLAGCDGGDERREQPRNAHALGHGASLTVAAARHDIAVSYRARTGPQGNDGDARLVVAQGAVLRNAGASGAAVRGPTGARVGRRPEGRVACKPKPRSSSSRGARSVPEGTDLVTPSSLPRSPVAAAPRRRAPSPSCRARPAAW